jgi:site-specific DNA-methyltransferase (adenine-specific)
MPDASVDHGIVDPPYNIAGDRPPLGWAFSSHVSIGEAWDRYSLQEFRDFTRSWMTEMTRVVRPNGNILIFGSYHSIYTVGAIAEDLDRKVLNSIIWTKPNAQPNITCRMLTESTEQILWLCNNSRKKATGWVFDYQGMKAENGGKQMRNYWSFPLTPPSERAHGKHPTQKPLALMERVVRMTTLPGDLVLDCFAGSGTTLVAAQRLGRRFVGVEREAEYVAIANRRLAAPSAQPPLFAVAQPQGSQDVEG